MRICSAGLIVFATASLVACGGGDDAAKSTAPPPSVESLLPDESVVAGVGSAVERDIEGVVAFELGKVIHTEDPVDYAEVPPIGGNHYPGWLNCGAYGEPQPSEQAVHSMEHGAVWITYDPALDAADVAELQTLTKNQTHLLVTPFPGLPSKVVASAWGFQIRLDGASDPRLKQFIETYQNGPQTPEPGAPCSGALGEPL